MPGLHLALLQARFVALLHRIELHGRIYFRHVRCPQRKADAIQEMRSLAWIWFLSLVEKGKDPADFVATFVSFLARAVKCGRRLAGMLKAKDVMNPATQQRRGFTVEPLPFSHRAGHERLYSDPNGQELVDAYEERLRDNTITPVPDQVIFRVDFPAWLATLTGRERRMIRLMARNERTLDLSRRFEVSPARISQLRREFRDGWLRFIADADDNVSGPARRPPTRRPCGPPSSAALTHVAPVPLDRRSHFLPVAKPQAQAVGMR
jgi:hypothetical protein